MMPPDRNQPAAQPGSYLAVGLMSGTSVDGIDAVLARYELTGDGMVRPVLLASLTAPIPARIRGEIFSLFEDGTGSLDRLARLDGELGELFAAAALEVIGNAGVHAREVAVIGSHGQTVRHLAGAPGTPGRASLQIGSGAVIAQRTGIPTANDFRPGDIAAGGTGAPLVPFFDRILADNFQKPVAFLNIGGIGNICWAGDAGELTAFDTGPGNMIADRLAGLLTGGALHYDRDGTFGSLGRIKTDLLERWMGHPFLAVPPPKSCGREEFGSVFFEAELARLLEGAAGVEREELLCSLVRTAEAFVAASIAGACRRFLPSLPRTMVVTGGGARNPLILRDLRETLPGVRILDGEEAGISIDFKEALAFGLFGLFRLLGIPNTEPRATGALRAVCAGALHLP